MSTQNGGNGTEHNKNYTVKVSCSKETKHLLTDDCVKEFLDHHPEMIGKHITQGHILRQVVEYYLKK